MSVLKFVIVTVQLILSGYSVNIGQYPAMDFILESGDAGCTAEISVSGAGPAKLLILSQNRRVTGYFKIRIFPTNSLLYWSHELKMHKFFAN